MTSGHRAARASYDAVAGAYAADIGGELAGKPIDRAVLQAFVELVGSGVVLDAGAGPGHVAAQLRGLGATVVSLDLSPAMCREALDAGIPAVAGDLTDVPIGSAALAGLLSLYAVIHLDDDDRAVAYREFARVLAPGGLLLLSFHVSDPDAAAGDERHFSTWWDRPVDLTFHFLDPDAEVAALVAAGFSLVARLEREPHPGAEHQSRRCTLLLRR